jgi:hypothetical protein
VHAMFRLALDTPSTAPTSAAPTILRAITTNSRCSGLSRADLSVLSRPHHFDQRGGSSLPRFRPLRDQHLLRGGFPEMESNSRDESDHCEQPSHSHIEGHMDHDTLADGIQQRNCWQEVFNVARRRKSASRTVTGLHAFSPADSR